MSSKIIYSKCFLEILEYVDSMFHDQYERLSGENKIHSLVLKWEFLFSKEYKRLLESNEDQLYYYSVADKAFSCENMAMLTVFNAISEEFEC